MAKEWTPAPSAAAPAREYPRGAALRRPFGAGEDIDAGVRDLTEEQAREMMPCNGRDGRWRDGYRLVSPEELDVRGRQTKTFTLPEAGVTAEVRGGVAEASSVAEVEIVLIDRDVVEETGGVGRILDPIEEVKGLPAGVDAESMVPDESEPTLERIEAGEDFEADGTEDGE